MNDRIENAPTNQLSPAGKCPTPKLPEVGNVILELDPPDIITPADNRVITPESLSDLLPSMRKIGQQVPGIVFPSPTMPGKFICAAGNRRLACCRFLGIKFKAVAIHGQVSKAELRRLRITENVLRKAMTPFELAADIAAHVQETECTQDEAAEFFGLSSGQVSKLLSVPKRLAPDLHQHVQNFDVCRDVARIISSLPTHEMQREVMKRAIDHDMKRDAVEALAKKMRGADRTKQKTIKLSGCGVSALAKGPTIESLQKFANGLAEAIKRLGKDGAPIELLPTLFASVLKA